MSETLTVESLKTGARIQFKPQPMDAILVTDENLDEVTAWVAERGGKTVVEHKQRMNGAPLIIGGISNPSTSSYSIGFGNFDVIVFADGRFSSYYSHDLVAKCEFSPQS